MSASENIPVYVLQPEISGQIKQTTLEEVKLWINSGELQPHHQVRIRNLSWVEARTVPAFQSLFESKKNEQTDHSSRSLPDAFAVRQNAAESGKAGISLNETSFPTAVKKESKPAEPSAVFKAFEKKALAKSKQLKTKNEPTGAKTKPIEPKKTAPKFSPAQSKMSPVVGKSLGFIAGCVLMLLLASGGSFLWVYYLKTPVEINAKNLPELARLEHKLTSEKLDLKLKTGEPENTSRQIAQLEKNFETQSKTAVENHRVKLENADFTATFSLSSAVLLALFLTGRIFYGKTSKPVEKRSPSKPSARQSPDISEIAETESEDLEDEFSENTGAENSPGENGEAGAVNSSLTEEFTDEISDTGEDENADESTTDRCSLHREKLSVSTCANCESHFCDECFKSFGEPENACPFCKAVFKSIAANTNKSPAKEVKKTNLLDLGKDSNFIVYEYEEERSKTAGIIQAFVVALLLSTAISILWTYKIHPYLQNPNTQSAQNVSPDESETEGQIPLNADPATYNKEIDDALKTGPCIDPETKQSFECDEETRRALYEHTRKTQSVEKAKKDVLNTAELLTGPKDENKEPDDPQIAAMKTEQKKKETRQLILSFGISFALIFGLLLATVFFGKDKKTFLNQNTGEDFEEPEEYCEEEISEDNIE